VVDQVVKVRDARDVFGAVDVVELVADEPADQVDAEPAQHRIRQLLFVDA